MTRKRQDNEPFNDGLCDDEKGAGDNSAENAKNIEIAKEAKNSEEENFKIADCGDTLSLSGKTVCFFGQLAGMSRKSASVLVRGAGGRVTTELHDGVNLVVLGEGRVLENDWYDLITRSNESTRTAFERGAIEIITESRLWESFPATAIDGVTKDSQPPVMTSGEGNPLYTASMLAELVSLPVPVIMHWYRSGLLQDSGRVGKLPYFDAFEFLVARQIRTLLSGEVTVDILTKRIKSFEARFNASGRVLMNLYLSADGKDVYYRQEGILYDWHGQPRLGFEEPFVTEPVSDEFGKESEEGDTGDGAVEDGAIEEQTGRYGSGSRRVVGGITENAFSSEGLYLEPEGEHEFAFQMGQHVFHWCEEAWRAEKEGDLEKAVTCYRAALMAGGADSGISFQLAEILEQQGDLAAAAERYYFVLELDEEYTEARIGLARVLSQLDRLSESVAAWEGVLADNPDMPEVHFELGKVLCRLGRFVEAEDHLRYFQSMEPNSIYCAEIDSLLGK